MSSKKISIITILLAKMPFLATFMSALLLIVTFQSAALETSLQLHKADQSGAYGLSFGIGDNFFNQKAFNWAASYNRLEDINITWNDDDINFALDTIDLTLSYRYYPKSYNTFIKSLVFEFQAGVGIALTENKFLWPDLEQQKFFSEQGDINAVLAFAIHKKLTKEVSMQLGVKHYPDYSEFGDVSSLYLGFSYQFGRQSGY